jgi:hypothetical protein
MKGQAVLTPKRSKVSPARQKGNSSLPRVIYHSSFGDLPLAPRNIVRTLPPMLVQDPSLAARNRAFERALRKILGGSPAARNRAVKPRPPIGGTTAAPVVKPAASPTVEEAEDGRIDCAEAPGPVAEPNEGAERRGVEPVEDATGQTLEDAPRAVQKRGPQRRHRTKVLRDPARQLLQELLTRGRLREYMKPWKVCQIFFKSWPKNKREISNKTVCRAWNELLQQLGAVDAASNK